MSQDDDRTYPPPAPHPHAVMLDEIVRGWGAALSRLCFARAASHETQSRGDAISGTSGDKPLKENVPKVPLHQGKRSRSTAPGGRQMSKITKSVMAGAVAALGLVAIGDLALGHNRSDARQEFGMTRGAVFALLPQIVSAETFEARWAAGFPAQPRVAMKAEAERPAPQTSAASDCGRQAWPYVSRDCLIAGAGAAPRGAVRTIALDRVERPGVERR